MTDQELADKILALGVGGVIEKSDWINEKGDYTIGLNSGSAKWFVRDWRVAGALMERVADMDAVYAFGGGMDYFCVEAWNDNATEYHDESLPRAIIEACCEAST